MFENNKCKKKQKQKQNNIFLCKNGEGHKLYKIVQGTVCQTGLTKIKKKKDNNIFD